MVNSTGAEAAGSPGAFAPDATIPDAAAHGFDAFRHRWQTQVGDGLRLPIFSAATIGDFRVRSRAAKVRDVTIIDVHGVSPVRAEGTHDDDGDQVWLYVVRRGSWTVDGPSDHEYTVSAGQFLLRHVGRPSHFETVPHTTAKKSSCPRPR